jgi:hypothetical protein
MLAESFRTDANPVSERYPASSTVQLKFDGMDSVTDEVVAGDRRQGPCSLASARSNNLHLVALPEASSDI